MMNAEKERKAVKALRSMSEGPEYDNGGYYLSYSGGKDSECLIVLAELAGVKYEIHHNHTTVDAPETVYHIRSIPNVIVHYPKMSMWQLIVKKGFPPTRMGRYCCEYLKEHGGEGRLKLLGIRTAESPKRASRTGLINIRGLTRAAMEQLYMNNPAVCHINDSGSIMMHTDNEAARNIVYSCDRTGECSINPIYDWTDSEVWEFLKHYDVKVNPLYSEGCRRIGCIGCPLAGGRQMKREFARWPKYRENYVRAFDRMVRRNKERGREKTWFTCGEDVMRWWCGDDPRQITLDDVDYFNFNYGPEPEDE